MICFQSTAQNFHNMIPIDINESHSWNTAQCFENVPYSLLRLLLGNWSTCLLSNHSVATQDCNYALHPSPTGERFLPYHVRATSTEAVWGLCGDALVTSPLLCDQEGMWAGRGTVQHQLLQLETALKLVLITMRFGLAPTLSRIRSTKPSVLINALSAV